MTTYNLEYTITDTEFLNDCKNGIINPNKDYTDIYEETYDLSFDELYNKLFYIKNTYCNFDILTVIQDKVFETIIVYNQTNRLLSIEITEYFT